MLCYSSVKDYALDLKAVLSDGAHICAGSQIVVQPLEEITIPPRSFGLVLCPTIKLSGGVYYNCRLTYEALCRGLLSSPLSFFLDEQETPSCLRLPVHNLSDQQITLNKEDDVFVLECHRIHY